MAIDQRPAIQSVMPGPKYTRKDLITSHKQIALGFLEQALAKTHEADEYIVEAKSRNLVV